MSELENKINDAGEVAGGEDFAGMLEDSLRPLNTGDAVTGVITSVTSGELHVDLGAKVTGIIPYDEVTDDASVKLTEAFQVTCFYYNPNIEPEAEFEHRFAELVRPMRLDKIQLNSLDRPGTEKDVSVSTEEAAQRFISALSGCAPVEFIRRFRASDASSGTAEKRLLELLKRGPLPREAVGRELDLSDFETDLLLKKLAFSGSIRLGQTDGVPCVALGK